MWPHLSNVSLCFAQPRLCARRAPLEADREPLDAAVLHGRRVQMHGGPPARLHCAAGRPSSRAGWGTGLPLLRLGLAAMQQLPAAPVACSFGMHRAWRDATQPHGDGKAPAPFPALDSPGKGMPRSTSNQPGPTAVTLHCRAQEPESDAAADNRHALKGTSNARRRGQRACSGAALI